MRTWHCTTLRQQKRMRMCEAPSKTEKMKEKMKEQSAILSQIRKQQREESALILISDEDDEAVCDISSDEPLEKKDIKARCEDVQQMRSWTLKDKWSHEHFRFENAAAPPEWLINGRGESYMTWIRREAIKKRLIQELGGYKPFMAARHKHLQESINEYKSAVRLRS